MVEIPDQRVDNRIFFKGMRWATPVESDFKRKIIKFRNKSQLPKKWAEDLSHRVREEFSINSIYTKYDAFLKEAFNI